MQIVQIIYKKFNDKLKLLHAKFGFINISKKRV